MIFYYDCHSCRMVCLINYLRYDWLSMNEWLLPVDPQIKSTHSSLQVWCVWFVVMNPNFEMSHKQVHFCQTSPLIKSLNQQTFTHQMCTLQQSADFGFMCHGSVWTHAAKPNTTSALTAESVHSVRTQTAAPPPPSLPFFFLFFFVAVSHCPGVWSGEM